jgi:hypothetical protein
MSAKTTDPAKIAKKIDDVIAQGAAAGLVLKRYQNPDNAYDGMSYIACEAVYHACGGLKSGLRVWMMHTGEREIHCFLRDSDGKVIDPTAKKYPRKVDYSTAKASSFVSTYPSVRAKVLADLVGITI